MTPTNARGGTADARRGPAGARGGPADERIERIRAAADTLFHERVRAQFTPSSAWAVFDRGGVIASGGAGDRGDGRPPDARTAYRIASCTKSFTAAAIMLLVERGSVALDDPITAWVPTFGRVRLPSADAPVPTLRMLVTMSAGFPTDDPWADRLESIDDDALDAILSDGLLFDSVPGTRFAYSNLGYALLGRVVGVASGIGYHAFVERELLRPLELTDTAFSAPSRVPVAVGHRPVGDGRFESLPWTGPGAFSSIGGLFSTTADLARWCGFLADAFADSAVPVAEQGDVGPSRAARRAMQQAARTMPKDARSIGYGFGLMVEERPGIGTVVSHSGGYPGYSAHMRWSVEDGIGAIAFENATGARVIDAAEQLHDASLRILRATDPVGDTSIGTARVLDATRRAQLLTMRLLADWSDRAADDLFTANVRLDCPYDERRRRAAEAFARAGIGAARSGAIDEWSEAPTHLAWRYPGSNGSVVVAIRLAPPMSGRVQALTVDWSSEGSAAS
ncbi:serine hydrolase domain-containing protein [Curtobacterium ammoniigenes]|uniref:serine hydrolase domain-containing protein n=1 Tax=Curtobacterium ammoniigenes TaxID=395387 RepID=UPI00083011B1|nr:serine hydrolase domain-containing protein [Curtobacterium ammoniigenes]